MYVKYCVSDEEFMTENDLSNLNEFAEHEEKSAKNIMIFTAEDDGEEYADEDDLEEEEY
jgi:hypothetical protein